MKAQISSAPCLDEWETVHLTMVHTQMVLAQQEDRESAQLLRQLAESMAIWPGGSLVTEVTDTAEGPTLGILYERTIIHRNLNLAQ